MDHPNEPRCEFSEPVTVGMALGRIELKIDGLHRKVDGLQELLKGLSPQDLTPEERSAFAERVKRLEALGDPATPKKEP